MKPKLDPLLDAFSDPGHGWLKVPVKLLIELGIADKITHYSYYRNGFAYLEEDCDMWLFHQTMEAAGRGYRQRRRYAENRSLIRGYASYRKEFYAKA